MLSTFFLGLHSLFTIHILGAYVWMSSLFLSNNFCVSDEFTFEEYSAPCSAGKVLMIQSNANWKKINKYLS